MRAKKGKGLTNAGSHLYSLIREEHKLPLLIQPVHLIYAKQCIYDKVSKGFFLMQRKIESESG